MIKLIETVQIDLARANQRIAELESALDQMNERQRLEWARAERAEMTLIRNREGLKAARAALQSVANWLMTDEDGILLADSDLWVNPFREAINATRKALPLISKALDGAA